MSVETWLILSASAWKFEAEGGQPANEGVTLNYLTGDVENEPTRRGAAPVKITAKASVMYDLQTLPGIYTVDLTTRAGAGGKAVIALRRVVDFVAPVEIFEALRSPAPAGNGKAH